MRARIAADDPRVGELIELCRSLRKSGGKRPRYTEPIKDLLRQMVESGGDLETIATSARITPDVARKWLEPRKPHHTMPQVQMLRLETPSQPPERRRVVMSVKTSDLEIAIYLVGKEGVT